MANFLGIKQVKFETYQATTLAEKIGYLWLVTHESATERSDGSYDIYFGSRKYSGNGTTLSNLCKSFQGFLDVDGSFILPVAKDFTSFDDSEVQNFSDILYALDAAIKANKNLLDNTYAKEDVDNLIGEIEDAIANCVTSVFVKTDEGTETELVKDDQGKVVIDLTNFATKEQLESAGKVQDVKDAEGNSLVDENGVATIVIPEVTIPEYSIEKANTEEGYAASYILTKDGEAVGSVINIPLDQVLESATIETVTEENNPYEGAVVGDKYIKFVFQNNTNPQYLPVQDLVDVYKAGEGIEISGDNTISVASVAAEKTIVKESIQIAGGPLANNVAETNDVWPSDWKDEAGNKIIPANVSLQEVLTALFLKVVEGTVKWGNASWSPTIAKPTVTLSTTGPVEVGSSVKVATLSAGAVSAKTRSVTCTCSQGYFEADEDGNPTGSHKTGNKTISVNAEITGDAVLTCTWNGSAVDVTVNETELVVGEGTNTISVTQSGQTATCDALPTTKVYGATNTKSLLSGVSATFSENKPVDKPLSTGNTATCEGKYMYFIGCYGDATFADKEYTVESIRTTDKKQEGFMDGKTIDTTIVVPAGTKGMYIAIPEGVDNDGASLDVVQTSALNTPVGSEMAENVRTMNAFNCAGTATKNYKVFTWAFNGGTAGEETFAIKSF